MSLKSLKIKWNKEYKHQRGIPSSFRTKPSSSVLYFYKFWQKNNKPDKGRILDVGCGKGRNSFFFARKNFRVDSMELLPELVSSVNKTAKVDNLKVKAICHNATEKLPYRNSLFDIVIDVYVYRYHIQAKKRTNFRKELYRILKDEGLYLLSLLDENDGYYGPLLKNSPKSKDKIVVDPYTKIPSFLSSKEDIQKEFFPNFKIVDFMHKKEKSQMHGKTYSRSTLFFIFKKVKL